MSAATKAALEDAIAAHVADETGDILTAWVVIAGRTNVDKMDDNSTYWSTYSPDTQEVFTSAGLLHLALTNINTEDD